MYKITYYGFNGAEISDYLLSARIARIGKAVCKATGCDEDNLIIVAQPSYNGKRHVEIMPLNEPSSACQRAVHAIHAEGFNVIALHNVQSVLWNKGLEK